jgi:hypothetical protein
MIRVTIVGVVQEATNDERRKWRRPHYHMPAKGSCRFKRKLQGNSIHISTVLRFCSAGRVDSPQKRGVHGFT